MSKNVILTDKDNNQLAPATTAEQVYYDKYTNLRHKIDNLSRFSTEPQKIICTNDTGHIADGSESPVQGLTVYGRSTQDGTPTPENPIEVKSVGDDGNLDIAVCGKNLFTSGIESQVSSYNTGFCKLYLSDYPWIKNTFSVSAVVTISDNRTNFRAKYEKRLGDVVVESNEVRMAYTNLVPFQVKLTVNKTNVEFDNIAISFADYSTTPNGISIPEFENIQFELGSSITEYTPPKAQTATIQLTEPLRAIPVPNGGNLAFGGKSYIADTLEVFADGRGKITRNIMKIVVDGTETLHKEGNYFIVDKPFPWISDASFLCNCFTPARSGYTIANNTILRTNKNGVTVCYPPLTTVDDFRNLICEKNNSGQPLTYHIIAEPLTERLTLEQVKAILALNTYKPITNITNSDGAPMQTTYVADLKTYIDNKFNELATALVASASEVE